MRALGVGVVLVVLTVACLLWRGNDPAPDVSPSADAGHVETESRVVERRDSAAANLNREPAQPPGVSVDIAPTSDTISIRLLVQDPDKQPVIGARVSATGELPPFVATTDETGFCTFSARKDVEDINLCIEFEHRHLHYWAEPQPSLSVTLPWSGPMHGQVVDDQTGAPIANVLVTSAQPECNRCPPGSVRSGSDGSFTLANVPRDQDLTLQFDVDGYACQSKSRRLPGRGEPVDCTFRLQRGVRVSGRLVDSVTHAPIAGATLSYWPDKVQRSDRDGRFSLLVWSGASQQANVTASADGYCDHRYQMPKRTTLKGLGRDDYVLLRTTQLTGIVRSTTGAAVPGAVVSPWPVQQTQPPHCPDGCRLHSRASNATTDAQGKFVIKGLMPQADYKLRVKHEDYKRTIQDRQGHLATTRPGQPMVTLTLEPKPFASGYGTIVGTYRCNGRLSDGHVEWRIGEHTGREGFDRSGHFRIERVPNGNVQLSVVAARFRGAKAAFARTVESTREVVLANDQVLAVDFAHDVEEATITGTVTRHDGTPLANQSLRGRSESFNTVHTRTNEDGTFSLPVPASLQSLTVYINEQDMQPRSQAARPGDAHVHFVARERFRLRIRAKDSKGQNLLPGIVIKRANKRLPRSVRFGAITPSGFQEVELVRDTYTVLVWNPDCARVIETVVLDQPRQVEVVLVRGATVTLRLATAFAAAHDGLAVRLVDERAEQVIGRAGPRPLANLDAAGIPIENVAAGRHRIVCENSLWDVVPNTVEVGNEDVTIELRVRRKQK